MAISCEIIPKVRDRVTGQKTDKDSNLFKDLLKATHTREQAIDFYGKSMSKDFLDAHPHITLDENGEPTIGSIIRDGDAINMVPNIEQFANESLHSEWVEDTFEGLDEKIDEIIQFNNNSRLRGAYIGTLEFTIMDGVRMVRGHAVRETQRSVEEFDSIVRSRNLNSKLRKVLTDAGVRVGVMSSLEERIGDKLGVHGITDFTTVKRASEGLVEIVRVAKGSIGETSLPEEFSHFVLEVLYDNPLVKRLFNYIEQYDLASDILGDKYELYSEQYGDDAYMLNNEALAHLMADYLLQGTISEDTAAQSLLNRLLPIFKRKFSQMSDVEIRNAINEISNSIGDTVKTVLYGKDVLHRSMTTSDRVFFRIGSDIKTMNEIMQIVIDREHKRRFIYYKNKKVADRTAINIDQYVAERNQIVNIARFVEQAYSQFKSMKTRLTEIIDKSDNISISTIAAQLSNIRSYIECYRDILEDIQASMENGLEINLQELELVPKSDRDYNGTFKQMVSDTLSIGNWLTSVWRQTAIDYVILPTFKPIMSEGITNPYTGEVTKLEDFIGKAQKDIGFLDCWLNNMANSGDWLNKILDSFVKQQKTKARLETDDYVKRIKAAGLKFQQSGHRDMDCIFEKDEDGNLTLNFVDEDGYNYGNYRNHRHRFKKQFFDRFGEDKKLWTKEQLEEYDAAVKGWHRENSIEGNGGFHYPNEKYKDGVYESMDSAQKEFLHEIRAIKKELDSNLPNGKSFRVPVILKDLIERIKDADSLKDGKSIVFASLKDEFVRRSDDTQFGSRTIVGFDGREVETLPVYYTELYKGEDANDVSTDIISTMCAYADMACNFKAMNAVIDQLNVTRAVADMERPYSTDPDGNPVMSVIKDMGHEVVEKLFKYDSNAMKQRDNWFSAQVFGKYFKDGSTIKLLGENVSVAKLIDFSNKMTSIAGLGFNVLAGLVNLEQGALTMNLEAVAKQFLDAKDLAKADGKFGELLMEYMPQIGSKSHTDLLTLFDEKFNVLQEYNRKVRDVHFNENWFRRMFGSDFLFVVNNAGELWLQNRTFFALAYSEKEALHSGSADGSETSILNAYKRKYIQKDGSLGDTDAGLGAKLVLTPNMYGKNRNGKYVKIYTTEEIKEARSKEDKTDFNRIKKEIDDGNAMSESAFVNTFSRRCAEINHRLHGNYDTESMNAIQRMAVGRMAMVFRKWMIPAYNRRFAKANYNFDLGTWTKGFYRDAFNILIKMRQECKQSQMTIAEYWDTLSEDEKANFLRAATEMGEFMSIWLTLVLVDWDDETNTSWSRKFIEWNLRRLKTEIGALTPSLGLPREALKILQSPAASVNYWQAIIDSLGIMNPFNWTEDAVMESGRFKGHTKGYKLLVTNPIIAPFDNDFYHLTHPEELIPWYKQ